MRILISETQYNSLLLVESKKNVIVDKIGMTPDDADILVKYCGPLAVLIGNKIYQSKISVVSDQYDLSIDDEMDKIKELIKKTNIITEWDIKDLVIVMNYIRTVLSGDFSDYTNSSWMKITNDAYSWESSKDISLKEESGEIILDYRNNNGLGYYWVKSQNSDCDDEAKLMKHCGRTNYGDLYSLRSTVYYKGEKMKIGHLSAEIYDNKLLQLRGVGNTKPKEKYHPYIVSLLLTKINGKYLIESIGQVGFRSESSFKITDLSGEYFWLLLEKRPDLKKYVDDIYTQQS